MHISLIDISYKYSTEISEISLISI